MKFLFETKDDELIINDGKESVLACLDDLKIEYELIDTKKIRDYWAEGSALFFGSIYGAKQIEKLPLDPGVISNSQTLKCSHYYPHFSKWLINKQHIFLPFGEVLSLKDYIFDYFAWSSGHMDCVTSLFIRPDSSLKPISSELVNYKDLEKWYIYNQSKLFPEDFVVISRPKKIMNEWRFWVTSHDVLGSSSYISDGEVDYNKPVPEVIGDYVAEILDSLNWQPDPVYTIDIGELMNGDLGIVELNSLSSSHQYGCDIKQLYYNLSRPRVWR